MRERNIVITICTIGVVSTENALARLKEFGLDAAAKFPQVGPPSDAALAIIKGGAQRWNDVEYPRAVVFGLTNLYHFIPEIFCAMARSLMS